MSVPDYNRDRRNETWHEAHGWSKRENQKRADRTKKKQRNREPDRFGKVNWEVYQHHQLYDMIMKADLGAMSTRASQWSTLAARIEGTTGEVQRVMERVMGAWRGQAAVRSAESNSRLMRWAGDASQTASKIAEGMATYTDAVDRAQRTMPEPGFATAERNFRDGYTVTGTGGPSTAVLLQQLLSDGMVSHEKARARKAEAVQVMENYESQSKDVHDSMPRFTEAAPTTNEQAPRWTPSPDPGSPTPGGPGVRPPSGPGPGTTPAPGTGVGGNSSTAAAGFADPTLSGLGGPGGQGSGGPGGGGGGAGGGYGGGLGSLGSGGSDIVRNSPGLGGPGGLAGAGPVPGRGPVGAGGVLGGRGGPAGAGAFGGLPMGGAQGEEDKEHKNKYHEGMDFFDDLPPAYPSVFGA